MKQLEVFRDPTPPWVFCMQDADVSFLIHAELPFVAEIDGSQWASKFDLFADVGANMAFPDYFGANWDAFDECLADLSWLPRGGYVLVISGIEDSPLASDSTLLDTFVSVLENVGKEWSAPSGGRRAVPFHSVFSVKRTTGLPKVLGSLPLLAL